ncbi:unnamed protein product [Phyllotreta striolata]|uniref:Chitin-binding type-2 domain-containing protein n=1 Tax=Phyllotreta striolata TaxID=444603 RepID=A0A9N9XPK9_PHYSR|nr:unnamed protein product [Phyllotreta striolata]
MIKFVLLVALVASCVNSQATTCPPEDLDYPVYIPDTTYCGKFYECSDGSPIGLECAPGTYYSITKQNAIFMWTAAIDVYPPPRFPHLLLHLPNQINMEIWKLLIVKNIIVNNK